MNVDTTGQTMAAIQVAMVRKVMDQALQSSKQLLESGMKPQPASLPSSAGAGLNIDTTA